MDGTESKVESIARKYGYYVDASTEVRGSRKVPVLVFTAVDRSKSPNVYFDAGRFGKKLTGIDRFSINHSAVGSLPIEDEAEVVRSINAAIQMCREINELDLEDLPELPEPTATESTVRSRIVGLSDKISRI